MTTTTRNPHRTRAWLGAWLFVAATLGGVSFAHGQKETERYIPIGRSPGLSGRYTSIGSITAVDARAKTITIADTAGPRTVQLTDTTRIWLDRSKARLTNVSGRWADLVPGRRVEAKYQLPVARGHVAEWVKIEIAQP
jgi:hypothetical protein